MEGRKRGDRVVQASQPDKKKQRLETTITGCQINSVYTSVEFQKELNNSWLNKRTYSSASTGAQLLSDPFQCCVLPSFVKDSSINADVSKVGGAGFLEQLRDELMRLKFYEKNNDLYQFHQSDDLKKFNSPCITALRTMFLDTCLPWLRSITGIELTDTIDMTCSKYEYTDVLLCHDDELEGRRIAFIFYLVPEWSREDGGMLDLFNIDEHGQPKEVVRSLVPVWNNFVFFDVNAVSFHQVAEVVTSSKTRLSVNGWFHGPPSPRPEPHREAVLPLRPPLSLDLKVLSDWVNPTYLDVGVQSQIQLQFEAESQIELPDFLLEEKYQQLCGEVQSIEQCKWLVKGPPNKRHIHLASSVSLSLVIKSFMDILQSEPFCLLLAHMTGLDLAHNVIRSANSHTKLANENEEEYSEKGAKPTGASNQGTGAKQSEERVNSSVGVEQPPQEDSSTENNETDAISEAPPLSLPAECPGEAATAAAECRCDLYRWQCGDYTLAGDESDPGYGKFCLDAVLSMSCEGWNIDQGGVVSYIAKDEDEELLSIAPSSNALSLVYRDEESLRFTKYINHRATLRTSSSSSSDCCYHSFVMMYKEMEMASKSPNSSVN